MRRNVSLPPLLALLLLSACSDSERLTRIETACRDAGKFDAPLCRCIAEGADQSTLSDLGIQWLEAQFGAADGETLKKGLSPDLTMVEYLKYADRIAEPERFCKDWRTEQGDTEP